MQRVVGDVVVAEVLPDARFVPIDERRELEQPVDVVGREHRQIGARDALFAAQPADPEVVPGERPGERGEFPDAAACVAERLALAEGVDAMGVREGFELGAVGGEDADAQIVVLLGLGEEVVGLGEEAPGVEGNDGDGQLEAGDEGGNHLVFGAEAGSEDEAPGEVRRGQLQACGGLEGQKIGI